MSEDYHFEMAFCRSILQQDPENLETLEMLAGYCTKAGDIDEGLELDRKVVHLAPDYAIGHYNLACSLAIKNQREAALAALREALDKGYRDFNWLMEDPDLSSLHDDPALSALLAEYQQ